MLTRHPYRQIQVSFSYPLRTFSTPPDFSQNPEKTTTVFLNTQEEIEVGIVMHFSASSIYNSVPTFKAIVNDPKLTVSHVDLINENVLKASRQPTPYFTFIFTFMETF